MRPEVRLMLRNSGSGARGKNSQIIFLWLTLLIFTTSACHSQVSSITMRVTHLLYPDFLEIHKVKMHEKFQIGDTDLSAGMVEFVPDFSIDTLTKKVVSLSSELNNPAFKVYVVQRKEKKEEAWAFFKTSIPHFTRQTGLRCEILEFKYKGKTYSRENKVEKKE